jgi:predicted ester cyclase
VFSEVWNYGRLDVLDQVLDEQFVAHGARDDESTKEALKTRVVQRRSELPNLRYVVHRVIVEGCWAATLWTGRGTPTGGFDMAGKGPQHFWGITIWRFTGSRIAEAWVLGDEASPG